VGGEDQKLTIKLFDWHLLLHLSFDYIVDERKI
jgi:hypothetical protein